MIEIGDFAKPLEGEKPAGENMEYDQAYLELDPLARGQGLTEGDGPDWKQLSKNCISLWGKTRDLRVAAYLTIAETAIGGIKELAAGLQLINFLVKEMWDTVYPLLNPEEDNDPTERINIFAMLSTETGAMNDPILFINRLRETKLMPPLPYTIRELLIAQGEIEPLDGQSVNLNLIIGELSGIPSQQFMEQAGYVKIAKEMIASICQEVNGKLVGETSLAMTTLAKEVDKLVKFFNNHVDTFVSPAKEEDIASEAAPETASRPSSGPGAGASGSVNIAAYKPVARADALLLLKKTIEYYQTMEPNSPVPLLLERALHIAQMNFLEILENIVPEALPHGKDILGVLNAPQTPAPGPRAASSANSPSIPRIERPSHPS
jgi:type VI secretion system protein ImpA